MKHRFALLIEEALLNQKNDVDKSFPSIFSREDVKHQLEEFGYGLITTILEMTNEDPKPSTSISAERIQELSDLLCSKLASRIDRLDSNEVVNFDSACFNITHSNYIELEEIDFDSANIVNEVENVVPQVLHDFFTPEEEGNPQEVVIGEVPYATYN